jgi:nicotinamide-nucleotide amidase
MIDTMIRENNPSVGVYAKYDGIHLRITAKADTREEALKLISRKESELRSVLDSYIWGSDDETIEGIIEKILIEQNRTVAVMEYQTGGFLSHTLTNGDGNSVVFSGGIIAQSSSTMESLGIAKSILQNHGLISCETATAMALAARSYFGSSIGIGISAVAGSNDMEGKHTGTVCIGIDDGTKKKELQVNYSGQRQQIKQRPSVAALVSLKQFLQQEN